MLLNVNSGSLDEKKNPTLNFNFIGSYQVTFIGSYQVTFIGSYQVTCIGSYQVTFISGYFHWFISGYLLVTSHIVYIGQLYKMMLC